MFRQYAYDYTGLTRAGVSPFPPAAPLSITVFLRPPGGRHFTNDSALLDIVRSVGLPVRVIRDAGQLSLKEMVRERRCTHH